ncbi:DEAD/DEAH box helicase family protein [Caulobacter sp. CCNWLY153]|uniref:DEAD/DEAH box helicase family protein n=1 Tax=unclassified Caulobacter TaxID=2648921 RepID=UPI002FEF7D77
MILTDEQKGVVRALREASASDFATLVALAGLDPSRDFRHANLRGVDFGAADLAGFDFTGADLTGADMSRASKAGAVFGDAPVDEDVAEDPFTSLRLYQRQAVEAVMARLREGTDRAAVSMPMGTGKSAVVLELARLLASEPEHGVLVVAPNRLLVDQLTMRFEELGHFRASGHKVRFCTVSKLRAFDSDELGAFTHVIYMDVEPGKHEPAGVMSKRIVVYTWTAVNWGMTPEFVNSVVFVYELPTAIEDGYLAPIERGRELLAVPSADWPDMLATCLKRFFLSIVHDGATLGKSVILCDEHVPPEDVVSLCDLVLDDLELQDLVQVSATPFAPGEVVHRPEHLVVRVYPWRRLTAHAMFGVVNVAVLSARAPGLLSRDWSVPMRITGRRGTARVYDYTGALSD